MVIFLGSSTVEHPAVNRRVVGSNPTRGASFHFGHIWLSYRRVNARKIKAFAQKVKGSEVTNLSEPFFLSLQNFQIFPELD